jgi:drug/metabolite transporter (DMT)-like permease
MISAIFLSSFFIYKKGLPSLKRMNISINYLLLIAGFGLCINYIFYILGLNLISPSTATIVIQLAPILMLFGSILFFKEHFGLRQWVGFLIFLAGLILFFNDRIDELLYRLSNYTMGVLLIVAAGILWAVYALAQKQLLKSFPSENVMIFIYILGTFLFLPLARPGDVLHLDGIGLVLLLFCALNTLFAYGCFAEALDHWEASRISMVLATTPLITVVGMKIVAVVAPGFLTPEKLNFLSITGACLVVIGSVVCVMRRVKL